MLSACSADDRPPNVVVILVDDLGYSDISPYDGWIETLALDRMAVEGLRFTDFHSSGAVCSPTRAGLLTGRYQQRAGIPGVIYADPRRNRNQGLHARELTFAEVFQDAGYATGIFGKWHLGYDIDFNPIRHGFDEFRGYVSDNIDYFSHVDAMGFSDWWHNGKQDYEQGYVTHLINNHATAFITRNRNRPFLLYIAHEAPHYPYQGPDDEPIREIGKQIPEQGEPAEILEAYQQMVEEMDKSIGEVLDTLEQLGLAENTLVLFLSDNGANQYGSNGDWRGAKGSLWEGGHRVPAIAWWPGKIKPGTTNELAISLDVMPTILDVAGLTLPEGHRLDGRSLGPILFEGQVREDRPLYWAHNEQLAVREGPWKLLTDTTGITPPELYKLDEDPGETTDQSAAYPERVEAMLQALEAWRLDVATGATEQPGYYTRF
jgi:arylsulfatase A-like enzyme